MFSKLKKLRSKRKAHHKEKREKKAAEKLTQDKTPSKTFSSSRHDLSQPELHFDPARRHSCIPAIVCGSSSNPRNRSGSHSSRSSLGSTSSAESFHMKRLGEIAQLDKYIEHVKKSADQDNISYIPNRLCCAQLLRSVLQRRERQYMHEYLQSKSKRRASEGDILAKSKRSNLNDGVNKSSNENVSSATCSNEDNKMSYLDCLNNNCQNSYSEHRDDGNTDNLESEEEGNEHRVPGNLLKTYDSDGTQEESVDSESEIEDSGYHRRYRPNSKTRGRTMSLYPKNFDIY